MRRDHDDWCWLTVLEPGAAHDFDEVATVAGIEALGKRWCEVDRTAAEEFLVAVLHRSLAYRVELMPLGTAQWLARAFLDSVGTHGSRFATNGEGRPMESGFSWNPATEHTFDAGVVAIGANGSALYWVADED